MVLTPLKIPNTVFNTNIESESLFNLKINSNCNNEVYPIPEPPACKTCKKLICKPLKDIGIDTNEINKKSTQKQLGVGGMNIVYDASYDDKKLALRLTKSFDHEIIKLEQIGLLYQAKLSKSKTDGGLECPYIAKVFDFGLYENINNISLPMKGVYGLLEKLPIDLLDRILSGVNFEEGDLKIMIKQLLQALSCMHNNNIYHFDIKPENIMMCDKGNQNIKLIDFGLCYTYNGEKTTNNKLTRRRGTPIYFSPGFYFRNKKLVEDKPYPIDDLWSIAITMCIILTGGYDLFVNFIPQTTWQDDNFVAILNNNKITSPDGSYINENGVKYSKQCIDFIKRIFLTVDNNKKSPTDTFTSLTADELLNDPWFRTRGGKRKSHKFRGKTNKKTRSKK